MEAGLKRYRSKHLDPGIAPLVQLLRAAGFPTVYSCQGGRGHQFARPTVDVRTLPSERTQMRVSLGRWAQQNNIAAKFCYMSHTPLGHLRKPHLHAWRMTFFPKTIDRLNHRL